ncbi:MAG: acyl-CoA dehydrogenase family protein [Polyangiaceae bacterium]|nr:acyl-CoA dehydrogenase family protein [Polyangiaceae bacterium]
MRFAFTEEQEAMQKATRAFLATAASSKEVRRASDTPRGWDEAAYAKAAGELGWAMLPFAEADGGLGLSWLEVGVVMEEIGRALFPSPYFSSVCLAGSALAALGDETARARWLAPLATGEATGALAWGPADSWRAEATTVTFREVDGGWRLDGEVPFAPGDADATTLLVAARGAGGEIGVFVVGDGDGVARAARPTLDVTQRFFSLSLRGARVPVDARLGGPGDAGPLLDRALAGAMAMLACRQIGAAEACLDAAVEYAKTRHQFGKPIGSFQAIKHQLADVLVSVELARSAAYEAAFLASRPGDELHESAWTAKALASAALSHAAGQSIQVHGGVGFTWEVDVHLYFKHAQQTEALLGAPWALREAYAARMGMGA